MSKNGWIACVIGLIAILCISIFCITIVLAGIAGYVSISPTLSWDFPLNPFLESTLTPSPVVIRPSPVGVTPTPGVLIATPVPQSTTATSVIALPTPATLVTSDTLTTLEHTLIPINNPIELAHRLQNLGDISPTVPPSSVPIEIGSQAIFWVGNGDNENFQVQATMQFITEHAYFWIEDGIRYRQRDLADLADSFENHIYPTDRSFFGSEWTPGVDGDPHIYILYAHGVGDHVAGYFISADEYPPAINPYSNAHEMFVFNADNSPLEDRYTFGVLAHELQHMIHWNLDRNETNWMNEGFSELAVLLNGFYDGGFDAIYTGDPDIQLNEWPDDTKEDTTSHYGGSFLFVTYFLDRFGEAATKALVSNQADGFDGIDSTLRQVKAVDPLTGQPVTADDLFLDWAITNYLMNGKVGDGRFAYTSYTGAPAVQPAQSYNRCPVGTVTDTVHQYGIDYIRFSCAGEYNLHFEGSIQTQLLPSDPHSGKNALWANKNDESDTSLTQTFDLTGLSGPVTLNYWTWYDIEDGWDYVYLEASTDGKNWQILDTPSGTSLNPHGSNYAWGYTGLSGGRLNPGWIYETIDLSQFAGQNLTLRFEYITDSNVTGEGFLLDDISIPEIGYASDFEDDTGGWQKDGWARIQNILPQTYRLALITEGSSTQVQYIHLRPDMTADIPIQIGDAVDKVTLVVAGTTRFTRQATAYRFSVSLP